MRIPVGYNEVKRRILSSIYAAEDAGLTKRQLLKVLLRNTIKQNDARTYNTTSSGSA
jgi:hypothetical protein